MNSVFTSTCVHRNSVYTAVRKTLSSLSRRRVHCPHHVTCRRGMGVMTRGETLTWPEIRALADYVREHGVAQFINQYRKTKDLVKTNFLWGDEIETMIMKFDHDRKAVRLSLKSSEIVEALQGYDGRRPRWRRVGEWTREYTAYQVENTPALPFGGSLSQLCQVEANMRKRRELMQSFLGPDEVAMNMTAFPRLGCPSFTHPPYKPHFSRTVWKSMFLPDQFVCPSHPRYTYLAQNLPLRRGEKMQVNVPIYRDTYTPEPFVEDLSLYGDDGTCQAMTLPDHIYMDAGGFGSANCCLQVTFQTRDVDEARVLYDQLIPVCPILMVLSAAAPVYRGYLADIDSRWSVLNQGWDDRTVEERGLEPLKTSRRRMARSRCNNSHLYISHQGEGYNDVHLDYDADIYRHLQENGVDSLLARHIAHLFTHDTISLYRDTIHQDDLNSTGHFENINSMYWQSLRFKVPPVDSDIGWRVEVRPMDLQVTDFENAAYALFVILLTRAILQYDLNLIIPMSKVDENMKRFHTKDAILNEKFYFRKEITPAFTTYNHSGEFYSEFTMDDEVAHMTIDEIINGKAPDFPGLMYFIRLYILSQNANVRTKRNLLNYMDFISRRASGEIKTTANSIRQFFTDHPLYKHDSVVTDRMNYDLLMKLAQEECGVFTDFDAKRLRN